MTAVPAGALALPRSYMERAGVQRVVGNLIDPDVAPFTVGGTEGTDRCCRIVISG